MSRTLDFRNAAKDLCLSISVTDVTVSRLSNAFQIDAATLYLKEEWGDLTYWPDENGPFNLATVANGDSLEVMGEARKQKFNDNGSCLSYSSASTSGALQLGKGKFKTLFRRAATSSSTFGIKVILAEMMKSGKGAKFTERNQTYICVNNDTATVSYITTKAREKFGERIILVSQNGLPIEDEEGTRGPKFWKVSSRKIYAIEGTKGRRERTKRPLKAIISSDEDSDVEISAKHSCKKTRHVLMSMREDLTSAVAIGEESKKLLADLMQVSGNLPLPPSVIKLVQDGFKCKVCLKAPMEPPVIATRCCNTLLGCSQCINNWYSGEGGLEKTCPQCREPRGYAHTFQFRGLDEFLNGFRTLLSQHLD